ncbi:hypothetical protein P2H44_17725 [Albimonas sp. CAU 1670]|uniref:hypothetical protein n=1 Tax=Albimonas sp. CAU 1670 TaxID=3032599 RepID=UPI0023DBDB45|nr:hypothetical protein [Albimonas sp. CAU 1670]MDF2234401.1 hypothetical protein [Albimonas sp. CAU 1670]
MRDGPMLEPQPRRTARRLAALVAATACLLACAPRAAAGDWEPVRLIDASELSGLAEDGRTRFHAVCLRDVRGYAFALRGYPGDALPRDAAEAFGLQIEVLLTLGSRRFVLPFAAIGEQENLWASPQVEARRLMDAMAAGRRMRLIGPSGVAANFSLDGSAWGVAAMRQTCGH